MPSIRYFQYSCDTVDQAISNSSKFQEWNVPFCLAPTIMLHSISDNSCYLAMNTDSQVVKLIDLRSGYFYNVMVK